MFKKTSKLFSSVPATVISGVFLALSLAKIKPIIDPAWITVVISGFPLLYIALWRLVYNKGITRISSALLISIAMIAAICIGDLFAAGEVSFIMAIGEILEDITTKRAKKGLKKLISLAPAQCRLIVNGKEKTVSPKDVKVGDVIRVLSGETIAVDGVVVNGETAVDESVMTGEALPVDKAAGDSVYSGTVNCFGVIDIKATKVGEDGSLQKLIRLVKEAEKQKAPMARIADKSAGYLVPAALLIAIITYIATREISRAVAVLVVFCPCSLVLATPTAIMAAIGQATKYGVIIKSGAALESMGKVDTFAFDKTGTLTYGKPSLSDVVTFCDTVTDEELLAKIASVETKSEHPLGKAVVNAATDKKLKLYETVDFKMSAGRGVRATVNEKPIYCGNERYLSECGVEINSIAEERIQALREEGKVVLLAAEEGKLLGAVALSDTLRPQSAEAVENLRKAGAESVLLTGDNSKTANNFGKKAGVSKIFAGLLPEDKVKKIAQLREDGHTVCMVGDGVNDAPALKTANVGVAMGAMGSDIAVEAADIALMGDDLTKLSYLKRLAVATVKTVRFSIALSMGINLVAVVLSIAGVLNTTTGALVHNLGSCFVVLIAALLYDRKFE